MVNITVKRILGEVHSCYINMVGTYRFFFLLLSYVLFYLTFHGINTSPLFQKRNCSWCPTWTSAGATRGYSLLSYHCYLGEEVNSHLTTTSFRSCRDQQGLPWASSSPDWTIPLASPDNKTYVPDTSPSSLPFFGHAPGPQCLSCSEKPKTTDNL